MSRTVSAGSLAAMFQQETDHEFSILLQLDHDLLTEGPIRVARSRGSIWSTACSSSTEQQEFLPFPFNVDMPPEYEEELPRSILSICNVDRRIVQAVREADSPVDATMHIVSATSTEWTVEAGPWSFILREVEYNAMQVSGDLRFEDWLNEPSPADTFAPSRVPGIFRSA